MANAIKDDHLWVNEPGSHGASLDSYRVFSDQVPPRLTEAEHIHFCQQLLQGTEEEKLQARRELTTHNLALVFEFGRTFVAAGFNPMIVIQAGAVAMFQSLKMYDYREGAIGTYTGRPIRTAIKRALNTSDILAIGETEKLWRAKRLLRQGQTLEQVAETIGFGDLLESDFPATEEIVLETEFNETLRHELQQALTPLQYRVVALRYGLADGYPYGIEAICQILELPRPTVSRTLRDAFIRLRSPGVKERRSPMWESLCG